MKKRLNQFWKRSFTIILWQHKHVMYVKYRDFIERDILLTTRMLSQWYQRTKLVPTLKKFYMRPNNLVDTFNVVVCRIVPDIFATDKPWADLKKTEKYLSRRFPIFLVSALSGMVGAACLPINTGFIFLNLFGLLECLVMWLISMPVIKV